MKKIFAIIGKRPIEGYAKTRLAVGVGEKEAMELYDAFIRDFFHALGRSSLAHLKIWFFGAPDERETKKYFSSLLEEEGFDFEYFPQPEVSFFNRLIHIFKQAAEEDIIYLTGTDIPDFPFDFIKDLDFSEVDYHVGPDEDGGFYFLATKAKNFELLNLDNVVAEGTSSVLEALLNQGDVLGLKKSLLPVWSDIDTVEDLRSFLDQKDPELCTITRLTSRKLGIIK